MSPGALNWQTFSIWAAVSLFASILSYIGCLVATRLSVSSGMIIQPGQRQSHEAATPTGGGLGLVFSLLVTAAVIQVFLPLPMFWWQGMLPGILLLAVIGWMDDQRSVSSSVRLLIQFIVSIWLLSFVCFQGSQVNINLGDIGRCAAIVVALVWLMNLYNFMDGSNGMAGFQGVFAGLVMAACFFSGGQAAMAMLSLSVAAVCAGFLPLNFPNASVFMGDVASVPLGFVFGALCIYGIRTDVMDLSLAVLVMAVFVVDATLTLLARVIQGEQWYTAHNQHVYQRLIALEWSHSQVLMVYQAINVMLVLPAIALVKVYPKYAMLTTGLVLLLLGACWYITNRMLGARAARRLE